MMHARWNGMSAMVRSALWTRSRVPARLLFTLACLSLALCLSIPSGHAEALRKIGALDLTTYRDKSFDAYSKALEERKYTVILFETDLCVFCKKLAANLEDPILAKYADQIVVSIAHDERDEGAQQLVEALGVVRFPTLVVLKTNSKNIHVSGRIEGEVTVAQIDRVFHKALSDPIDGK